ncbi:MAG: hypothetical protein IKU71_02955 [Kiritimatiellae bacterium]|nr:hypothetical protein [Kiritimatiellia bacterium]
MTALEYLLDGLEAELELERELGVRVVELDRTLLATPQVASPVRAPSASLSASSSNSNSHSNSSSPSNSNSPSNSPTPPLTHSSTPSLSFAFLHDRPLSPNGIEMMAKIVTAMHETPETAPIVFTGERPPAKMYVVLGSEAMKKWYPGMRGAPGQWLRGRNGEDVLLTYSPEYLLRFGAATPALMKLKREMWTSLKGVMQRLGHSK